MYFLQIDTTIVGPESLHQIIQQHFILQESEQKELLDKYDQLGVHAPANLLFLVPHFSTYNHSMNYKIQDNGHGRLSIRMAQKKQQSWNPNGFLIILGRFLCWVLNHLEIKLEIKIPYVIGDTDNGVKDTGLLAVTERQIAELRMSRVYHHTIEENLIPWDE